MMHLLRLRFRFQLCSEKTILSAPFRVKLESATPVPRTQSIFHERAQLTRSIAMGANNPDCSPVAIHGMSLIPSIIETRSPPSLLVPTLVALP
jgi:hypothetical protein